MTDKIRKATTDELNDLLDEEREALLQGDLEKLAGLLVPKETLIEALNAEAQTDLPLMQMLDGKVKRNQLLLNGALDGIRTVSQRMARLREVKGALETYGADGKRHNLPAGTTDCSVERRA
ncbi:FlgN-like protein [Sulfitobacter noctilucae]|uniref:flagellar protein FlgN n=1 Tax=Sulfitobacter noctilucae TaxID=1342302 RepID=UPI00046AFF2F|nr:flagellar protein FlgN [Sulfitobacter noctilucae]KIN65913.1 FlgN-like protein [Sulfitobacter noctilucae]